MALRTALAAGVLGSFFVISKEMLAFVLDEHAGLPWYRDTIRPARELAYAPSWLFFEWIHRYSYGGAVPLAYFIGFFASLAWVVVFAALQLWAVVAFSRNSISALWPLKLLRTIANISATVAYIPLFQFLLSVYVCRPTVRLAVHASPRLNRHAVAPPAAHLQDHKTFWEKAGYTCFAGAHLGLAIVAAVLAAVLLTLCALFALLFYDSHPLSSDIAGKAHGRAEFAMLLLRSLLVILVQTAGPYMGPWPVIASLLVASFTWRAIYLWMMPYTHHSLNRAQLAVATVFGLGAICLVAAQINPAFDAAIAFYIGVPLAAIVGVYLADSRRNTIMQTPALQLRSPYEVELKARYTLADAFDRAQHAMSGDDSDGEDAVVGAAVKPTTARHRSTRPNSHHSAPAVDGATAAGAGGARRTGKSRAAMWRVSYDQMDVEARAKVVRELLPHAVVATVEALYRKGVLLFPNSPILQVFMARTYGVYFANKQLLMGHLLQAQRLHPPLDVGFLVYQARRNMESSAGAVSSALHRVSFEKHLTDARVYVLRAAAAKADLWGELLEATPSLMRLHTVASTVATASAGAEAAFTELFSISPQSVVAMRLLAQYHSVVTNNGDKAGAVAEEAERLEEAKAKESSLSGNITQAFGLKLFEEVAVDLQNDNAGIVAISAESRDLGTIVTVNSAACRLFGYTRNQLERVANISQLMPEPIASLHDGFMRRYLATGEGKFVASTRSLLALSRSGHVFPMLLSVRESGETEGSTTFVGTMRAVPTPDHYIVMDGDYTITATDAITYTYLGTDPEGLKEEPAHITRLVPDFDSLVDALVEPRGTDLIFVARGSGGGAAAFPAGSSDVGGGADAASHSSRTPPTRGRSLTDARGKSVGPTVAARARTSIAGKPGAVAVQAHLQRMAVPGATICILAYHVTAGTGNGADETMPLPLALGGATAAARTASASTLPLSGPGSGCVFSRSSAAKPASHPPVPLHPLPGAVDHGGSPSTASTESPRAVESSAQEHINGQRGVAHSGRHAPSVTALSMATPTLVTLARPSARAAATGAATAVGAAATLHLLSPSQAAPAGSAARGGSDGTSIAAGTTDPSTYIATHTTVGAPAPAGISVVLGLVEWDVHEAGDAAAAPTTAMPASSPPDDVLQAARARPGWSAVGVASSHGGGASSLPLGGPFASTAAVRAGGGSRDEGGPLGNPAGPVKPSPHDSGSASWPDNTSSSDGHVTMAMRSGARAEPRPGDATAASARRNRRERVPAVATGAPLTTTGSGSAVRFVALGGGVSAVPTGAGTGLAVAPPRLGGGDDEEAAVVAAAASASDDDRHESSLGAQWMESAGDTEAPTARPPLSGNASSNSMGVPGVASSGLRSTSRGRRRQRGGQPRLSHVRDADEEEAAGMMPQRDRGSVGGSSSQSGGKRTMARLRRLLMASSGSRITMVALQRLWWVGAALLFLNVTMGVVAAVVLVQAVAAFSTAVTYADLAARNTVTLFAAQQVLHPLLLASTGWVAPPANITVLQLEAAALGSSFARGHQATYEILRALGLGSYFTDVTLEILVFHDAVIPAGQVTEEEAAAITEASGVRFVTVPGGGLMAAEPVKQSLLDAGFAVAGYLQRVAQMNASDLTVTSPALQGFYLNTVAGADFHEAVEHLIENAFHSTDTARLRLTATSLALFVGMGVGLLLLSAAFIVPVTCAVDRARDGVMGRLLEAPLPVLAVLRDIAMKQSRALQRQLDGTDGESSGDSSAEEADGGGGSARDGVRDPFNVAGAVETGDVDAVKWDSLFAASALAGAAGDPHDGDGSPALRNAAASRYVRASRTAVATTTAAAPRVAAPPPTLPQPARGPATTGHKVRAAFKSWWSYLALLVFLLPNLIVLAQFAAVYGATTRVIPSLLNAQLAYTVASLRTVFVTELNINLQRCIAGGIDAHDAIRSQRDDNWATMNELLSVHMDLMYDIESDQLTSFREGIELEPPIGHLQGNEADGYPQQTADANAALRSLVLSDACPTLSRLAPVSSLVTTPTVGECAGFMSGLLRTGGMHGVMVAYLDIIATRMALLELTAVGSTSSSGNGTMTIPPAAAYFATRAGVAVGSTANATVLPYSIGQALTSADVALVGELDTRYLRPLAILTMSLYRDSVLTLVGDYQTTVVALLAVGMAIVTAGIAGLFLPSVLAMDRDVQRKRALLLLLPPQALRYLPGVRQYVEQILSRSTGAGTAAHGLQRGGSGGVSVMAL